MPKTDAHPAWCTCDQCAEDAIRRQAAAQEWPESYLDAVLKRLRALQAGELARKAEAAVCAGGVCPTEARLCHPDSGGCRVRRGLDPDPYKTDAAVKLLRDTFKGD